MACFTIVYLITQQEELHLKRDQRSQKVKKRRLICERKTNEEKETKEAKSHNEDYKEEDTKNLVVRCMKIYII